MNDPSPLLVPLMAVVFGASSNLPSIQPPPPSVKALFRAPFKTCPMDRFVMSEDGNMVASTEDDEEFHPGGEFMIPRGWGRTSYTKGAGPTHDAWCDWFDASIPRGTLAPECARLLNEAWK